jgi:hypothetical protein
LYTSREFKLELSGADSAGMRSVTGLCIAFGTLAGGFVPELWGASGFSLVAVLTSALGGIAGVWVGAKVSA